MSNKYTLKDLTIDTLRNAKMPLSPDEIWHTACEMGLNKRLDSYGKTPFATIGAYIYTDIKNKADSSIFVQTSKRPARFSLKDTPFLCTEAELNNDGSSNAIKTLFQERDLHPILSTYVYSCPHFKCYTKTIYHEKSAKDKKGKNKWLHPDIVGVYFPFDDYDQSTLEMIESFSENSIKLFSFEMKIEIDMAHLREYFFQAVSNSSWANEGYLVALKYSDDSDFRDEMRRLNNAFGIGFIKLNADDFAQSEIILSARENKMLDWETINRLVEENPDFKMFIDYINEDKKVKKVKSKYDDILSANQMSDYVKKHKIIE